jgi:hypothetical protein
MVVYSPPECSLVAIGLGQVQNCFHVTLARGRSTVFPGCPSEAVNCRSAKRLRGSLGLHAGRFIHSRRRRPIQNPHYQTKTEIEFRKMVITDRARAA